MNRTFIARNPNSIGVIYMRIDLRYVAAGLAAGSITGILGSGGGLILVPFLTVLCKEDSEMVFPRSLSIMLPICLCSLLAQRSLAAVSLSDVLPYLIGGAIGGVLSLVAAKRIPLLWLHRFFGCILLWSGFRCLFS